jgi:transcriptional regulator
MYRPPQNAVDDPAQLHAVIASYPFATIASATDEGVQFAYAPVVHDQALGAPGTIRFHLARGNPLARVSNGTRLSFSFRGSDAYISPDWYRSPAMVPTWNYIAIEASGVANVLDEAGLRTLLDDLSAQEEAKLAPKRPWTMDKVPEERQRVLMNAIVGFSVKLDSLKGKFKLGQEKSVADFEGAIAGLVGRGDPASLSIAAEMKSRR